TYVNIVRAIERGELKVPATKASVIVAGLVTPDNHIAAIASNHFGQQHAERILIRNFLQAVLDQKKDRREILNGLADEVQAKIDEITRVLKTDTAQQSNEKLLPVFQWINQTLGSPLKSMRLFSSI